MKRFFKLAALVAVLVCGACDDDKEYVEPVLPVTPYNIDGTWRLSEWNGAAPQEGCYIYIEFVRQDMRFTMYQNVDSHYARKRTGRYSITDEDVIWGVYDYGVGDWERRYKVTGLTADRMTWTVTDDPDDISVYTRCESIPEDILNEGGGNGDEE